MKAFLYLRVSTEEQSKHGYSLDAQEEALKEFCRQRDHVIVGIYRDEGISGRKPYTKRPAMLQLLKDIELVRPDIVLFTKLDRWFRNIREYYKVQDILDRYKVNWKAINEEYDTSTASGRLYVNIKLSIAQDEADRTAERVKDIQSQLVAQGKVLGGKVPIGYKIENKKLVFGDNIDMTRDAIEHYLVHQSVNATTRYINDKYGTTIAHPNMLKLLRNPILKGEYRGNPAFCEPLITAEKWDRLQTTLGHNIKHATKRVFLFTGLMRCPLCGRRLCGSHTKGQMYYRCMRHVDHTCTFTLSVNEKRIERWLLDNIEEDFNVNVTMKPKKKKDDPCKYRDRLKRLNNMYLLGNITDAEYKELSLELQQKLAAIQKSPTPKPIKFSSTWKELYHELDREHQRSFWRQIVQEIKIDENGQVIGVLY